MRLAAPWTDSYPVAEFWFIWSVKLGLPEYLKVYITLWLMNTDRAMPSKRQQLDVAMSHAERDLRVIQAIVLALLAVLLGYAACLIYKQDWQALLALLPPTTAACAAVLVAKTATRLLTYNMLIRADDRSQDIVRCIHHSMALVNDLRSRIQYMKAALVKGDRPLAALTQNADAIEKRYEALYDRELYRFLPGDVSDAIGAMSGSMFGLSALVASVASAFYNKGHQMLPPDKSDSRASIVQACESLENQLDELFSRFQALRHAET